MSMTMNGWLILTGFFVLLDIIVVSVLLLKRSANSKRERLEERERKVLFKLLKNADPKNVLKIHISRYFDIKKVVTLDSGRKENAEKYVDIPKAEGLYAKRLHSFFKIRRIESSVNLGLLGTEEARRNLEASLLEERDPTVKLYMANALSDIGNKESLPVLVASLINGRRFYRDRVNMLIADFGNEFDQYLPKIRDREDIEIKELLVDFASVYYSESSRGYLESLIGERDEGVRRLKTAYGIDGQRTCVNCIHGHFLENGDRACSIRKDRVFTCACKRHKVIPVSINYTASYTDLIHKAYHIMAEYYPLSLLKRIGLETDDAQIRAAYVEAVAKVSSEDRVDRLIAFLGHEDTRRPAVHALSLLIEKNPSMISAMTKRFHQETDNEIKKELSKVLASRIEYFIMKLTSKSRKDSVLLLRDIILLGRRSEVIDFLNKNKDIDIENELVEILKGVVKSSPELREECARYLNERLLEKCGIEKAPEDKKGEVQEKDKKLVSKLYLLLGSAILIFPLIFLFRHGVGIFSLPFVEQLKLYILDFNYYIIYYAMTISAIYLILLFLSYLNVKKQVNLWEIKNMSLMFKRKMLPSISIVAPAFNEEKTVIQSVHSLLNLEYPEYEVILVNDGSSDGTLNTLIRHYDLKRVDYMYTKKLGTKPLRGVYMNRSIPKLIVVDKENGGKGDSLNAGINISKKEYFCGIDADSLLDSDALLKLASMTLDQGMETPALGGNILPINGSEVENGQIKEVKIPRGFLGRLQTMEYIRAFKSGRLGWAEINGLLIISGAFGLFRTERVISAGGYLTKSGAFNKDTVGEDMELVVRISKSMKEKKLPFKICYSYNANCWTEVPEDMKTLKKQRYRWHKGLIDNLTFHSKMLFNPKYGIDGTLSLPYFFVFEMMGPIIEVQGIIMIILAFFFGLLNTEIALLLFIFTVMTGTLISTASLMITEKDTSYFKKHDLIILIGYAVMENFGPRQFISLWRVGAFFSMMKKPVVWDKAQRKGFNENIKREGVLVRKEVAE